MGDFLQSVVNLIDPYLMQIIINIGLAIIMALGLNLITGVTGQLSLGHAAFMSIGAFTGAILTIHFKMPFLPNLFLSGLTAALAGVLIGFPTLRLSGDYLAITTLGFAEIVKVIFLNLKVTNRALGLSVPLPQTSIPLFFYVWIIAGLTIFAMVFIENSRIGRAFKAIREDEIAAEAMGVNSTRYKVQAFAIGAFCAGLGGSLYAHVIAFIGPSDFGFLKSVDFLSMTVLGGLGSIPGAILGASLLAVSLEFLRFMQQYRMLFYGALLVFLMIFRPNGILGGINFKQLVIKTFKSLLKDSKNKSPML